MKQMRAPLALFCFVLASPAMAQEPSPSPSDPPRRQETVNVEAELPAVPPSATAATRLPVAVMELPVSVSVVPRQPVERAGRVRRSATRCATPAA